MEQEMRYVYQVYLEGSVSKAAEKLFITQPALSVAIQRTESRLGMPLFDRKTRPLTLTPAGEAYISAVKQALQLERELEQRMNDIRDLHTGSLLIGGTHYLNAYILPEILSGFSRKFPGIRLQLVEHSAATLAEMLSERELDLTLNCDPKFLMDFERYPAFCDTILLAVPEADPIHESLGENALSAKDIQKDVHLRAECPTVPLERFREIPFLLLNEGNNLHERSLQLFQEAGYEPIVKMSLAQLVTAYHLAEYGFAATFVSDRLVKSESSRLKFYKLDSTLIHRQFFILLPKRGYTSFATKAFIAYFRDFLPF